MTLTRLQPHFKPKVNPVTVLSFFELRRRLEGARSYMDSAYQRPLDLDQIARQACFSRFHFIRLFRQAYGCTPHQYLVQQRIAQAKVLLAANQLSITEVCLAVGFQSLGSFSLLFRRQVGLSPSDFRARCLDRQTHPQKYIPNCFLFMAGIEHPLANRQSSN